MKAPARNYGTRVRSVADVGCGRSASVEGLSNLKSRRPAETGVWLVTSVVVFKYCLVGLNGKSLFSFCFSTLDSKKVVVEVSFLVVSGVVFLRIYWIS